jgi:hypothetical protein
MADRWQRELAKLRRAELPEGLWDRVLEGPRWQPPPPPARSRAMAVATALVVFAVAAVIAARAFGPLRPPDRTLAGPDVLAVPARGDVAADFLPDGHPVFVVHHDDGTVTVVDAFSSHRAWGFEEPVAYCPSTREFVEWAHEAHFDEYGRWVSAGPAPSGLATFAFDAVEQDPSGDPIAIRVGAIQAPDPGHSPAVTDPSRPPFCPPVEGRSNEVLAHAIDGSAIWNSPADAVAATPEGWIVVRGTLLVSREDGFVQLCGTVVRGRCEDGAVVRGVDGVGLLVNVLIPHPGSGYETSRLWLVRVRGGVLDDPGIIRFWHVR